MKQILIIVDMQNDFIDGALGTKEAVAIVPKVEDKIRNFDGEVFFTRDTHENWYLETQEGKNLPVPHCIRGTEGWQIRKELDALRKNPSIRRLLVLRIWLQICWLFMKTRRSAVLRW